MKNIPALRICGCGIFLAVLGFYFGRFHSTNSTPQRTLSVSTGLANDSAAAHSGGIRLGKREIRTNTIIDQLLDVLNSDSDLTHHDLAIQHAVALVSNDDLVPVLDSLAGKESSPAALLRDLLVRRWAEVNAASAAVWVCERLTGTAQTSGLAQVGVAWAHSDLAAAVNWLERQPENANKENTTVSVAYEAARTDPVIALELATKLSRSTARDALMVHAVSQWAAVDSTAASAWVNTLDDTAPKQPLVAAVAIALAQQDGAAAATMAANSMSPGEEQDRAVVSIVQRWANQAPEKAASWIELFPESPTRDTAVEYLVARWTKSDKKGVMAWLNGLCQSSLRDAALAEFGQSALRAVPPIPVSQ